MQISDAISGKCIFRHISANNAHSSIIKVSNPMFLRSKSIIKLFLKSSEVSNICYCANIAAINEKFIFRYSSANIKDN